MLTIYLLFLLLNISAFGAIINHNIRGSCRLSSRSGFGRETLTVDGRRVGVKDFSYDQLSDNNDRVPATA